MHHRFLKRGGNQSKAKDKKEKVVNMKLLQRSLTIVVIPLIMFFGLFPDILKANQNEIVYRMANNELTERFYKAHIDQKGLIQINPQRHMIKLDAKLSIAAIHARIEHRNMVAKLRKQPAKHPIQLVAKATTPLIDNLVI